MNLIDEGFDIAVRVGNPGDTSLITRRLCDMQGVIATSPDYPTRHSEPASPTSLVDHDCIIDTNFRDPSSGAFVEDMALKRPGGSFSLPFDERPHSLSIRDPWGTFITIATRET